MKNKIIKRSLLFSIFLYCSTMGMQASFVDFLIQQGYLSDEEVEEQSESEDFLEEADVVDEKDLLKMDVDYLHRHQKALLKACYQNNLKRFKTLKKEIISCSRDKKDFDIQWDFLCNPEDEPTPLLWATLSNNLDMVMALVDYADYDNIFNQSVLYWAVRLEYTDIVTLLLAKGFNPHQVCRHYHDVFNNRDQRARHIKKRILKLHEKREMYRESMTPMQEAMIKKNQVILSSLRFFDSAIRQKKEKNTVMVDNEFEEEIDCAIPACPVITLAALPFVHFGYLYVSQLYAVSNSTLPASTDSTYF